MHTIGGLTIVLLSISLTSLISESVKTVFLAALLTTLIAGVLWELLQYGSYAIGWHTFNALQLGWSDTLSDLASDVVGGVLAWLLWLDIKDRKNYGTTT